MIINKIIKAIEQRNDKVIHEGVECLALDVKDGVLLWCESTGWLGIRKDKTYYSAIQDRHITQFRNVPIYKKNSGKIYFLKPELKELLKEIKRC